MCISGSGGKSLLRLIDDSGDTNQGIVRQTKYNVVSGSLTGGVQNSTEIFGEVYPQHGIIILGDLMIHHH